MSFSIYKSPATLARESRENRARQMQKEVERREKMRQSVGQNSARNVRAQEVRDIEQARDEYQREFQAYYQKMRESILVSPDPDGFFDAGPALDTDPAVERDIHWNLFLKDHPDFYNSEVNRDVLSQYFTVNSCRRYDRWVLAAAYKRLLSLGVLETAAEFQEPAVMIHEQPTLEPIKVERPGEPIRFDEEGPIYSVHTYNFDSKFAKRDDRIEGRNPENGFAWICTKTELDRMSADNFKRFASITKAVQSLNGLSSDYGTKYMG
jgi:hypothetical protein